VFHTWTVGACGPWSSPVEPNPPHMFVTWKKMEEVALKVIWMHAVPLISDLLSMLRRSLSVPLCSLETRQWCT